MKKVKQFFTTWAILLLMATPAFAVDTTLVYSSGILVVLFLGLCALIVVAQMIPALVYFGSLMYGIFRKNKTLEAIKQDD